MWIFHAVMLGMLMLLFSQRSNSPKRRVRRALLVSYCLLVFAFTVLDRETSASFRYELVPFWSYRAKMFDEIFLNYLMFLPIGYWMTAMTKNRKSLVFAFFFTVTIEVLQLVLRRGLFEFDDIIGNTFGAYLGYCLYFWPLRVQFYHKFTREKRLARQRMLAQQIKPSIASHKAANELEGAEVIKSAEPDPATETSKANIAPKIHYSGYGQSSHHGHHSHHGSHGHHSHHEHHGHHEHRHHYKEYYRYEDEYNTLTNRIIRHRSHINRMFSS